MVLRNDTGLLEDGKGELGKEFGTATYNPDALVNNIIFGRGTFNHKMDLIQEHLKGLPCTQAHGFLDALERVTTAHSGDAMNSLKAGHPLQAYSDWLTNFKLRQDLPFEKAILHERAFLDLRFFELYLPPLLSGNWLTPKRIPIVR